MGELTSKIEQFEQYLKEKEKEAKDTSPKLSDEEFKLLREFAYQLEGLRQADKAKMEELFKIKKSLTREEVEKYWLEFNDQVQALESEERFKVLREKVKAAGWSLEDLEDYSDI